MSRHQDIRNLDYKGVMDDYEGYSDDENEPSEEDQALMKQGTAEVQAALGVEVSKVTTAQIEEALWHYYYDVDKSVAYLISKFIDPPKKKATKPAQKSNGAAGARQPYWPTSSGHAQRPLSGFFSDMPWGNIPKDREAVFIAAPRPRGGLLGGSGAPSKMSKLQQLAAARKKKNELNATSEQVAQTQSKMADLSVDESEKTKENKPLTGTYGKRLKTSERTSEGCHPLRLAEPARVETQTQPHVEPVEELEAAGELNIQQPPLVAKARPSMFGKLLSGPADGRKRKLLQDIPLPYLEIAPTALNVFSTPSPDDVVLAAQAKAGKKIAVSPAKKKSSSPRSSTPDGGLKIDDAPLPKSKHLNVISEFQKSDSKRAASFVVVGHVDAGKSTMMGRLLLDLKVVDQRAVDKLRNEAEKIGKTSFALAWVLDQRTEERNRGVTIDIATNRFETEATAFTILDAPGHRDFIPNMIAGASQADFAILVIDAGTGAFESGLKGQTREHSLLIRSMGVSRIIVAINKLDTVGWSRERFDEIKHQVSGFLSATGFQAKNISFVPVSGLHGDNLVNRSSNPEAAWYSGPTLVEELENSEPNKRALAKPLRMTISEVFRTAQSPVSVAGRVEAGSLQMGDAVLVQPSGEKAYIKSLQVDEAPVDWAVAGQNAVLHLSHIDAIHVRVGDIICDPTKPIPCLDTFTLKALAFDFLMPMQVDVHRGRLHSAGRIEVLAALLDKTTGTVTKKKPKIIKPASVARLVVKLESKVPLEAGQRVVLRSGGETVAAGLLE